MAGCGSVYLLMRRRAAVREYVLKRDFQVCLKCRHDLSGLDHKGVCPECGTTYDFSALRVTWNARLQMSDGQDSNA